MQENINTFEELMKWKAPKEQKFTVYAYFLTDEKIIKETGIYGYHIQLGNYETRKEANKVVNEIIQQTGHKLIYSAPICSWQEINSTIDNERTKWITENGKKNLKQQQQKEIMYEQEMIKKREKINKEISEEKDKELDKTTIEHYTHNWYLAIRNYSMIEYYKDKLNKIEEKFNNRVKNIKEQYSKQPEYEKKWLDVLKEKLKNRDEENIYELIKTGYETLKSKIIN